MRNKKWVRLVAYVTGSVNQELLLQNEYLAAENRILRTKLPTKLRLSNPERATLAEIKLLFVSIVLDRNVLLFSKSSRRSLRSCEPELGGPCRLHARG
jgi:hypothetical protein